MEIAGGTVVSLIPRREKHTRVPAASKTFSMLTLDIESFDSKWFACTCRYYVIHDTSTAYVAR